MLDRDHLDQGDRHDAAPDRPYEQVLADAVRVMTEAARLTWSSDDPDGETVTRPADWAEFVAQTLAGAAANVGGIEQALAGRPGSWEADYVRNLLASTVGHDEEHLLEHRTEPLVLKVFVDELLVDLGVWKAYDDARAEIARRHAAISPGASTAELARALPPLTQEQEQRLEELEDLEQHLEDQRAGEWARYSQALQSHIDTAARQLPGLRVPVLVRVDIDSFQSDDAGDRGTGLLGRLLMDAIEATPLPYGFDAQALSSMDAASVLDRLTAPTPPPAAGADDLQDQP
jgi:hypothetical protein